jgi:hypothetical protein
MRDHPPFGVRNPSFCQTEFSDPARRGSRRRVGVGKFRARFLGRDNDLRRDSVECQFEASKLTSSAVVGPADVFKRRVMQLIERTKAIPRQPGVDEIRIPSERAFRSRERALREGLEIDRLVFDALVALRAGTA